MSANPVGQIGQILPCQCKQKKQTERQSMAEDKEKAVKAISGLIFAPSSISTGMMGVVTGLFNVFNPFLSLVNNDTKITVEPFSKWLYSRSN